MASKISEYKIIRLLYFFVTVLLNINVFEYKFEIIKIKFEHFHIVIKKVQ